MEELEALASTPSFSATSISVNTMAAFVATDASFWAQLGVEYDPKARVNQHWYERRGYVVYKTEARYKEKDTLGEEILVPAVVRLPLVFSCESILMTVRSLYSSCGNRYPSRRLELATSS